MDCCWQNIKEHKHIQPSKTKSPHAKQGSLQYPVSRYVRCFVWRQLIVWPQIGRSRARWLIRRGPVTAILSTLSTISTPSTLSVMPVIHQLLLIGNQNEKQSALSCWVVLQTSELLRLQPGFSHFLSVLLECLLNIILLYKVSNIVGIHPDSKHKQYRIQYLSGLRQRRGNEWNFLENISNTGLLWPPWMLLLCWPALQQRINKWPS